MYSVNVISFNPDIFHSPEFGNFLSSLDVNYVLYEDITFVDHSDINNGSVNLFLFDSATVSDHSVLRRLNEGFPDLKQTVNLCLATEIPTDSVPELCSIFDDFVFWPCCRRELKARIRKFQCHFNYPEPDAREQALIDQFAAMNLTGRSPLFLEAISLIKRLSRCHAAVLIEGETGTGKENAARAMHYFGARQEHSFVPVNCAAIPDELFESELFGHERGAFTDAKLAQKGLVEIANGGTLFLDEVDSLSLKAQAALLRFLQAQEYRPLGSRKIRQANVRIIAATNANLREQSRHRGFREDLYFRLNVLRLVMPALRHRKSDIPLIAESLLEKFSKQHHVEPKLLSRESLRLLSERRWEGNVRELENFLLREFLLSDERVINLEALTPLDRSEPDHDFALKPDNGDPPNFQDAKARAISQFEVNYLEQLLSRTNGNISAAARMAGKERRALGKLLQKYNIDKSAYQLDSSPV